MISKEKSCSHYVRHYNKTGNCSYAWKCDDPQALNAYRGEYMTQYSWSEFTHGALENERTTENDVWRTPLQEASFSRFLQGSFYLLLFSINTDCLIAILFPDLIKIYKNLSNSCINFILHWIHWRFCDTCHGIFRIKMGQRVFRRSVESHQEEKTLLFSDGAW